MKSHGKTRFNLNSAFRQDVINSFDCDIFAVCETFLRCDIDIFFSDYKWYGHHRKNLHSNARRGSGGVGCFVKRSLLEKFDINVENKTVEDILWLKIESLFSKESIYLCICYLPPENSSRQVDAEQFYAELIKQVYQYQNYGKIIICGDFNSRIGEESDYIEGVDNIPIRQVIDTTSNKYGNHLLDFLVDCNMCIVNGRVGSNDFTHVSHRGCSVVDYVIVPHEQLLASAHFSVHTMSNVINDLKLQGCTKSSDHSVLVYEIDICNSVAENISEQNSTSAHNVLFALAFLPDFTPEIAVFRGKVGYPLML